MQQDILINWSPQETRVAVVEQGAVQELHVCLLYTSDAADE